MTASNNKLLQFLNKIKSTIKKHRNKSIALSVFAVVLFIGIYLFLTINPPINNSSNTNQNSKRDLTNSYSPLIVGSKFETFSKYLQPLKNKPEKELLKAIFAVLDSTAHYISAESSDSNYTYAINAFKKYLNTSQSREMTTKDFQQLSPNLRILQTKNGRVIAYEPNPLIYGLINAGNCAYYQNLAEKKLQLSSLYEYVTKHIGYIYEVRQNLLIISGVDKYVNPYFAFIDGFSISNNKVSIKPVLNNYTNSLWKITSTNGWIQRNSNDYIGTSIFSASDTTLIIKSTDMKKLILKYDENAKKYIPQN